MPKSWAFRTPPPSYRRRIVTPYPDTRPAPTLHRLPDPDPEPKGRRGYPPTRPHQRTRPIDPSFRHSGPRAGTQGGAATPQPSSPRHSPSPQPLTGHPLHPSFRRGRNPGDTRKPPLNHHPPVVHLHPSFRTPIRNPGARLPPQPSSTSTLHVPSPGEHRLSGAGVEPHQTCHPRYFRAPINPEVRVGQREYDTNRVPPLSRPQTCVGAAGCHGRPPGRGASEVEGSYPLTNSPAIPFPLTTANARP